MGWREPVVFAQNDLEAQAFLRGRGRRDEVEGLHGGADLTRCDAHVRIGCQRVERHEDDLRRRAPARRHLDGCRTYRERRVVALELGTEAGMWGERKTRLLRP